jgi:predicted DNA binding CopG/RHH family protein
MKPVQYFTPEYLEQCRRMTPDQVIRFLEDFRMLHAGRAGGSRSRSRLISLKVPEDLLELFKARARLAGRPYQTVIKELMRAWVLSKEPR